MTKRDPTGLSMEKKLKAPYQLQTTLSGISERRTLRGELPLEVQDLEDEIAGLTTRVEKIETDIDEFKKTVTQKKADTASAESNMERCKKQLDEVKNNREYDTLAEEIEFQGLEIQLCNKKIKGALIKVEEKDADSAEAEEPIKDYTITLREKKEELDDIMQETRDEKEKLRNKASELEVTIEPRLLLNFKRIRKDSQNGLSIIYVQRDACGGCFNKIPPQRQLDIKMHKEVIVYEYYGRVMIDPELADVRIEKDATEEKPKRKRTVRRTAKKNEEDR